MQSEVLQDGGRKGDRASLAVFGRGQAEFPAFLRRLFELLLDSQRTMLEINAIPCQPQYLTLTYPRKERNQVEIFVLVTADFAYESCPLFLGHRLDLRLHAARWLASGDGVVADVLVLDRLLHRLVKTAVQAFQRFWR